MHVQSKRANLDDVSLDYISNMPRNILGKILELLPTRDAVSTSILSSKWRNNWTAAQKLVFDVKFFCDPRNERLENRYRFLQTINEVLLLHNHPVLKFDLYIPSFLKEYQDIDRWILFLSRNGIKELSLDNISNYLEHDGLPHKLPSYLFSCVMLTHLKLSNFVLKPPTGFSGFPHLKSLEATLITFQASEQVVQTFFSSSVSLERLILSSCSGVGHLRICAPDLKVFNFNIEFGNRGAIFISFSDSSVLNLSQELTPDFLQSLSYLPRLEKLILPGCYVKEKPANGVLKMQPVTVDFLKYVELTEIDFGDLNQVSGCLCLIRSSPNLQELHVSPLFSRQRTTSAKVLEFLKSVNCSDFMLHQLRVVRMLSTNCIDTELEFIKYLLAASPKLVLFFIRKHHGVTIDAAVRMSCELLRFPRASSKAEIDYVVGNR